MGKASELRIGEMSASELYQTIVEKGISEAEAAVIVGDWIHEHYGQGRHTFTYSEEFAAEDTSCTHKGGRIFHHDDWQDGESVVQAEETAGEEGFNRRFHRIEDDIDRLDGDVAKAFTCMATMRRSLHDLLNEIRTEINRLNDFLYDLGDKVDAGPDYSIDNNLHLDRYTSGTGLYVGKTTYGKEILDVFKTDRGLVIVPSIPTPGPGPVEEERVRRAAGLARYLAEDEAVREAFTGKTVTKKELVERFGDVRTKSGQTVAELVEILPEAGRYRTLDQVVEAVTEREAAVLRTTGAAGKVIATALGVEAPGQTIAQAGVDRMTTIPAEARAALLQRGIDTVGKLAAASASDVTHLLAEEGVRGVSFGDVAEWTATAKTYAKL